MKKKKVIEAIVFGGLDGIVTTYAIVVAAAASNVTISYLLIVSCCNLVADAIGMAVSDYFSSVAEEEFLGSKKKLFSDLVHTHPEELKYALKKKLEERGIESASAAVMTSILSKYENIFLEFTLQEIYGIMPEDEKAASPLKGAIITFFAFVAIGIIPLLSYICSGKYQQVAEIDLVFGISIGLFALAM